MENLRKCVFIVCFTRSEWVRKFPQRWGVQEVKAELPGFYLLWEHGVNPFSITSLVWMYINVQVNLRCTYLAQRQFKNWPNEILYGYESFKSDSLFFIVTFLIVELFSVMISLIVVDICAFSHQTNFSCLDLVTFNPATVGAVFTFSCLILSITEADPADFINRLLNDNWLNQWLHLKMLLKTD